MAAYALGVQPRTPGRDGQGTQSSTDPSSSERPPTSQTARSSTSIPEEKSTTSSRESQRSDKLRAAQLAEVKAAE
eukprot:2624357-Heterocapsa_arctica.AAC.1